MPLDPRIPLEVLNPGDIQKQQDAHAMSQAQTAASRQSTSDAAQLQPGALQEQGQTIDTNKLSMLKSKNDLALQALGTVVDQPSYDRAKAWATQQGLDVSRFPDQYDPAVIQQARISAGNMSNYFSNLIKANGQNFQAGKAVGDISASGFQPIALPGMAPPVTAAPSVPQIKTAANIPPVDLNAPQTQAPAPTPAPPGIAPQGVQTFGPPQPTFGPPAPNQSVQSSSVLPPAQTPQTSNQPSQQLSDAPPVKNAGETVQAYNSRLNAWKTQKLLSLQTNRLGETERHNQVTEGQGLPGAGTPLDTTKTGDDFLKTLPPNVQATVKGVADGTIAMPQPNMRSPVAMKQWEDFMAMVKQYDPSADVNRKANSLKFDTGPQGNQIRSINVAVQHLDTLSQLTDALGNGDVQSLNKIANTFQSQFGAPAPNNFNAAKQIVADEIVKSVVGAGGGQGDRDKAQADVDSANSPEQLKGVIATWKSFMGGQAKGLGKQYEDTTGRKDFNSKLLPQTIDAIGGNVKTFKNPSDPGFSDLPAGSKFIDAATGQQMVKH